MTHRHDGGSADDAAGQGSGAADAPVAGPGADGGGTSAGAGPAAGPAGSTRTASARRPAAHRSVGRSIVSGLGELLLTLGVVVLLLVVYEVYVTDLFGAQKQAAATEVLDEKWAEAGTAEVTVTAPGSTAGGTQTTAAPGSVDPKQQEVDPSKRTKKYSTEMGQGFAKLYIPSFGTDWTFTVIEGTDSEDLYTGPGHYVDSQFPGQPGNFAVAGHRVSKGSPFNDLGLLNACDSIVVETQDDWFVYRVLPMQDQIAGWDASKHPHCEGVSPLTGKYANTFGRSIVLPSDYAVVHPVPGSSSAEVPDKAERLITLTTCHPQFSDRERMIIHGVLVRSYAKAPGFLPPELSAES
ncbi:class E sortase [Nakamurella lactea]|uniref:class E sortase n=1 Tax=Nakamurella lactea TaxID=459515 RepID=UPI000424E2F9|nr:class E sortase [Nakamurella lactea]